jgi:glycogen synthase
MKILFISPDFYPSIGGVEQIVLGLAKTLTEGDHKITVITRTTNSKEELFDFKIIRDFSLKSMLTAIKSCDIAVYFNLSLKNFLPFFLTKVPLVIVHGGLPGYQSIQLKKWISFLRASSQISCSNFVASHFKSSVIIPNFYQDEIFYQNGIKSKPIFDIVFLGRLVPEKGCDILLRAISQLPFTKFIPRVLIIGGGPEEYNLKKLSNELKLSDYIHFAGEKTEKDLAQMLNECKIMVVPSICKEGFGIVALEGIACGCMVIGSEKGGLKEAIGPCGFTFPNGDANALTEAIKKVLNHPELIEYHQKFAPEHLQKHTQNVIAHQYLKVFEEVLAKKSNRIRI